MVASTYDWESSPSLSVMKLKFSARFDMSNAASSITSPTFETPSTIPSDLRLSTATCVGQKEKMKPYRLVSYLSPRAFSS